MANASDAMMNFVATIFSFIRYGKNSSSSSRASRAGW
jgi:hypothetical protein